MEMWLHLNGKDYPINLGQTITDNMGEELDSMNVLVSHVPEMRMKPFDDAYVHNMGAGGYEGREYGKLHTVVSGEFYRHFSVYSYDKRELNQVDGLYNYSIQLVSETKYLEKIPMPNRTITIPFNAFGRSVFDMAKIFVSRYTPKIKISDDAHTWRYADRFTVSESSMFDSADRAELAKRRLLIVEETFSDIQAPETSFNNPTLREALTKIFSVRNCIPVVYDGIVFARDISQRGNEITEIKGKIWDTESMSGDQYCDRLRKNYANGLTDKNGCVFHEYVGFRNMDVASMRFSDLKIEVKNPIYKVNKLMMCYYSRKKLGRVLKIDITDFVLPSSTRAMLSNDYMEFEEKKPNSVNGYYDLNGNYVLGICDYKFMTVQYGIGDTSITGFGDMVRYTSNGVDYKQRTVLENIINYGISTVYGLKEFDSEATSVNYAHIVDSHRQPFDNYQVSDIYAKQPDPSVWSWVANASSKLINLFSSANSGQDGSEGIVSADTLRMKSVFFEIEYQGMISSAVMVSKDRHDGDIYAIDNQQESMAVMEQDGITSKYKANRLGNKTCVVTARVTDFADLVEIGDYDAKHGVCFKRTLSVEKDFLSVNYVFVKDYVLMNYFTGVFSKYRSSAYASFGQSVERNENTDLHLLLSKDTLLRSPQSGLGYSYHFDLDNVVSIFKESDSINHSLAYFSVIAPIPDVPATQSGGNLAVQHYAVDRANYMSGDSMCCTFGMPDSETAGTYIKQPFPKVTKPLADVLKATSGYHSDGMDAYSTYALMDSPLNDITGSAQGFLMLPKSRNDGVLENVEFGICFSSSGIQDSAYRASVMQGEDTVVGLYDDKLFMLPKLSSDVVSSINSETRKFRILEKYKDAKEVINETFQIEPIVGEGVRVSPLFLKLSDLFGHSLERRTSAHTVPHPSVPFLTYTTQILQYDYMHSPRYRVVHSLALYTELGDAGSKELKKLEGVELNGIEVPIKYYDNDVELLPTSDNDVIVRTRLILKRIVSVGSESIRVAMKIICEVNGSVEASSKNIWGDVRRMESDEFEVEWKARNVYSSYDDGLHRFADGSNDLFPDNVPNRSIYVYNFDSFPVDALVVTKRNGDVEDVSTNTADLAEPLYGYIGLIRQGLTGACDVYEMQDYNGGVYETDTTFTKEYDSKGPRKLYSLPLSGYQNASILSPNLVWFGRSSKIPEGLDRMKTYADESSIISDGYGMLSLKNSASGVSGETMRIVSDDEGYGSAYLFYKGADQRYRFVFAVDNDDGAEGFSATVFLSLVPDRSRTVFDASVMEPTLQTENYVENGEIISNDNNACRIINGE